MMSRVTLLLATVLLSLVSIGQGVVTITDGQGQVVNGSLISHPAMQSTDTVKLMSRLTSTTPKEINVRRYELWTVPNTENFFCWGVCYLPVGEGVKPTWISQHFVDMNPGANYNNFSAYYSSNGQPASTTRYRFVWYNVENPLGADSSWVDIEFGGAVGIQERATKALELAVWPNPSNGQDVQVDHAFDGSPAGVSLVLYTVLGERLNSWDLSSAAGRSMLPTSELGAGVYFVNVERNGRILGTRRVVVTR